MLLLLMLPPIQMTMVTATPETVVKVEPYASFAQVSETSTISITLIDVQYLYGVDASLSWNASILQVVDVDTRLGVEEYPDGVLHKNLIIHWNITDNTKGEYRLAASSTGHAPSFSGSGTIVRIAFNVTNSGSCELDLETTLANAEDPSMPIPHTTIDGFFGSSINISISPTTINIGENVSIGGFIIPAQEDVFVTILCKSHEETEWSMLKTAKTDENGAYSYMWTPEKTGKYYLKSSAVILDMEKRSPVISISVSAPEQPPWLYVGILTTVIIVGIVILLIYQKRKQKH